MKQVKLGIVKYNHQFLSMKILVMVQANCLTKKVKCII